VYLCEAFDRVTFKVLAWQLANTLSANFCLDAVREAGIQYSRPGELKRRSREQLVSQEFSDLLNAYGIQPSMMAGADGETAFLWNCCGGASNTLRCVSVPGEPVGNVQQGLARHLYSLS
jgi:hypothetical protein